MAAKDLYEKDFYKVLGVDKKAAADEIKRKYRNLVKDLHPDTNHGDSAKEEKFKAVSEAYEILSDPKKRAEYDEARTLANALREAADHLRNLRELCYEHEFPCHHDRPSYPLMLHRDPYES
jgi:DnaJ-class molecular chaperone